MLFLAGLVVALVLVYLVMVLGLQRSMLFPAPLVAAGSGPPADVERVWLEVGGHRVEAWYLAPPAAGPVPVVISTHGNGEVIDLWVEDFRRVRDAGVGVLLLEYPGYGRSGGRPSERSITATAIAAWDWLAARPEVDAGRIVGWGRSLGGGAVCALAAERSLAALVLESSFTSVRDMARRMGVVGPLVLDPFDNLHQVSRFDGPVLVLHGRRDGVIPFEHGQRLAAAARSARMVEMDCGHNDCPFPWSEVRAFLAAEGVLSPR